MLGQSPFEGISGTAKPQATPVHHEDVKGPLEEQIHGHDQALKGYMGRIASGETLHPDEYHEYESRMTEKAHDAALLNRLNKQHGVLERRGKTDIEKHQGEGTRTKATELLNEYGGGTQ